MPFQGVRNETKSKFKRKNTTHFTIEFPFPEGEYRYKIWESLFPMEAPISDDIDYEFLARRFKLAGGNIKNIVVNSAFLAAKNSGVIAMEDVINAAKREFQRIGKVCSQPEFGKYSELICKE